MRLPEEKTESSRRSHRAVLEGRGTICGGEPRRGRAFLLGADCTARSGKSFAAASSCGSRRTLRQECSCCQGVFAGWATGFGGRAFAPPPPPSCPPLHTPPPRPPP